MEKSSVRPSSDHAVILSTAPSVEVAETIVRTLVSEHMIACGTILPGATSIYTWDGAVHHASEVQLLLKTCTELAPTTAARLAELHPYDVPEVLILPVTAGSEPYLQWITDVTRP